MNWKKRFKEADKLFNAYEYDKAIPMLQELADEGYMPAQFHLGWCYENGEGVQKNYIKAFEWYRKSAKQGFTMAREQ